MADDSSKQESRPVSVYDLLRFSFDSFAELAWLKMGFMPDRITGQIAENFDEAKVAIDCASRMAEYLEQHLEDAQRREIQNTLSDLRMNFIRKTGGE